MNIVHLLKYIGFAGIMGLIIATGDITNEILGGVLIITIVVLDIIDLKIYAKKKIIQK